ncbi:MAG: hypothetical protein A3I61_04975 [Acidobacteria bacterium RIFCSPLOWO2_02_FULL_68_18]|nr:MAG: hypothetical protein A3I61_04975 [Acidobacteria bacterium RIFCSPLOWO2_02_FULL_68_18]
MGSAILRSVLGVMLAAMSAASVAVVMAQAPSGATPTLNLDNTDAAIKAAADAAKRDAALKNYAPPRTAWGDPDLRGVYLTATYTPLQRPPELANKPLYTEEEAVAAFKKAVEADAEVDPRTVHYDWKEYSMDAWQGGARPSLQTSLIIDPPDGRLPPLTPEAQERRQLAAAAAKKRSPAAGILTFGNTYTRCILGLGAGPLVRGGNPGADSAAAAAGVTAEVQIFQSPGYVTLVMQSNNDVRIIPLDGRPHVSDKIRHWYGDPRGRWDGNTLVVETTNWKDRRPSVNFQGATDAMHLVERFTRIAPETMQYEYTMTDPKTWTRPWTARGEMPRVEPNLLYEFACHEQNYGMINVVRGTQIREREAASGGRPAPQRGGGGE